MYAKVFVDLSEVIQCVNWLTLGTFGGDCTVAESTLVSAVFAEFGDCVPKCTVGADQDTSVSGVIIKKVSFATLILTAICSSSRTTHAVRVTHLTVIRIGGTNELTYRTTIIAYSRSNIQIVLCSYNSNSNIATTETVVFGRIVTSFTGRVTSCAGIVTWVLIVSVNTINDTSSIFQEQR